MNGLRPAGPRELAMTSMGWQIPWWVDGQEAISVGGEWAMGRERAPTCSAHRSALPSASSAWGADGGETRGRFWRTAGHAAVLGDGIVREYVGRGLSVSVCV